MTGRPGSLSSSHMVSLVSHYFPHKNMAEIHLVGVLIKKENPSVKKNISGFLTGNSDLVLKVLVSEQPTALENVLATSHKARESVCRLRDPSWVDSFHFPCRTMSLRFLCTGSENFQQSCQCWSLATGIYSFKVASLIFSHPQRECHVLPNPRKESWYSKWRRIRLTNHNNIKNFYFLFIFCCVKFCYYTHSFVTKWKRKSKVNLCKCSTQLNLLNIQSCCFIPFSFFQNTCCV